MNNDMPTKNLFIAFIAGAALTTAFAPLHFSLLAFILPDVLLFLIFQQNKKQAFFTGLSWGLGFFGAGVSWIYISIHTYGNTSPPIAIFITVLFIMILALFFAVQAWAFATTRTWPVLVRCLLVFPLLWVLQEYIRSHLFTGFPWLLLAHTQTDGLFTPSFNILLQHHFYQSYFYCQDEIITFILVLSGSLISPIAQQHSRYFNTFSNILCIPLGLLLAYSYGAFHHEMPHAISTKSLNVALVQSNIPEEEKWKPDALENILNIQQILTDQVKNADLIVWPESAIPDIEKNIQPLLNELHFEQIQQHRYLISGFIATDKQGRYYNALRVFGAQQQEYHKYHLVPFGEFLPFEKQLKGLIGFFDIPMSNLTPGPQYQPLFIINNKNIAPFICYEIAYTDQLKHYLPKADLLLVVSNDAWFGHSWAAAQHLQIARWRAMQAQKPLLFASNDGITAVIDAHGHIVKQLPPFTRDVLQQRIVL